MAVPAVPGSFTTQATLTQEADATQTTIYVTTNTFALSPVRIRVDNELMFVTSIGTHPTLGPFLVVTRARDFSVGASHLAAAAVRTRVPGTYTVGNINDAVTQFLVNNLDGFPQVPFTVVCGTEHMLVTAATGGPRPVTLTVTRGTDSTVAAAHNSFSTVTLFVPALTPTPGAITLTADVGVGATSTMQITDSSTLSVGDLITVAPEIMKITAIPDGTSITVLRGQGGSTISAHFIDDVVAPFTAPTPARVFVTLASGIRADATSLRLTPASAFAGLFADGANFSIKVDDEVFLGIITSRNTQNDTCIFSKDTRLASGISNSPSTFHNLGAGVTLATVVDRLSTRLAPTSPGIDETDTIIDVDTDGASVFFGRPLPFVIQLDRELVMVTDVLARQRTDRGFTGSVRVIRGISDTSKTRHGSGSNIFVPAENPDFSPYLPPFVLESSGAGLGSSIAVPDPNGGP